TTSKAVKGLFKAPVSTSEYSGTLIPDSLMISGVVISSDKEGNLYRTLYIQDETGGIEIKIGKSGLYNDYPVGMRLYVLCKDLMLGSYGTMVGIGWNDETKQYETAYIDVQRIIDTHIFKGEMEGAPTPVEISTSAGITSSNVGKLVKIVGAKVRSVTATSLSSGAKVETNGTVYIDGISYAMSTWAVSASSTIGNGTAYSGNQNYYVGTRYLVVRTSGYSKFADETAPAIGSTVDMTGILTIYNTTYQLVLNSSSDVVVK
ncbi:MAG: DUF5689 domain-containing protein, partial [Bacteroidales bacterium]